MWNVQPFLFSQQVLKKKSIPSETQLHQNSPVHTEKGLRIASEILASEFWNDWAVSGWVLLCFWFVCARNVRVCNKKGVFHTEDSTFLFVQTSGSWLHLLSFNHCEVVWPWFCVCTGGRNQFSEVSLCFHKLCYITKANSSSKVTGEYCSKNK